MAHHEACELWIEQQIEAGLEDGKTKYAIGREIAAEIYKLFEVKVKPHTIEKKAQRQAKKDLRTNVRNEQKDPQPSENPTISSDENTPQTIHDPAEEAVPPKCKICEVNLVRISFKNVRAKDGLCRGCSNKKKDEWKNDIPALDEEQKNLREAGWSEINKMMEDIIQFVLGKELYPMLISKKLKTQIKENLDRLIDIIKWDERKGANNGKI